MWRGSRSCTRIVGLCFDCSGGDGVEAVWGEFLKPGGK